MQIKTPRFLARLFGTFSVWILSKSGLLQMSRKQKKIPIYVEIIRQYGGFDWDEGHSARIWTILFHRKIELLLFLICWGKDY